LIGAFDLPCFFFRATARLTPPFAQLDVDSMKEHRIDPGSKVKLSDIDPDDTGDYPANDKGKAAAEEDLQRLLDKIRKLQERLYARSTDAFLIVLQAMDTGGKDGTIKRVMSGVNPLGCRAISFKVPTAIELAHDFLWRVHHEVPRTGHIGIFNRSHYEDVLVTRVHGQITDKVADQRYMHINNFERLLAQSRTTVVKFFLHISKDEQKKRLEARLRDPEKQWKFNPSDLEERKLWPKYQAVYETTIAATSTECAPWYVVPANHKWYRNVVVASTVVSALEKLKLKRVPPPPGVDLSKIRIT
jgi:PPK2 family polyphosphate:nucleotide phosphotransferase